MTPRDDRVAAWGSRLRLAWVNHLYATASRLDEKARKAERRADDCRTFASRHLRKLEGYLNAE